MYTSGVVPQMETPVNSVAGKLIHHQWVFFINAYIYLNENTSNIAVFIPSNLVLDSFLLNGIDY